MRPVILVHAAALALAAGPAIAAPRTVQVTSSAADASVERIPVAPRNRWMAVRSQGDLTPGLPGNAGGAQQIWRADLFSGALVQATTSATGDVACPRVSLDGDLVIASREDLTPGAPGNADGSWESWVFDASADELVQATASAEDSFFQTFTDGRRTAYYVSKGDLTPGAPGNTDGSNDVYEYDVRARTMRQITATTRGAVIRGVTVRQTHGILETNDDLILRGNQDQTREVYLVDLRTLEFEQLTESSADARLVGRDESGRYLAIESYGDLVAGGNTDGSREVFVWDSFERRLVQATASSGDASFAAFVPRSPLLAVHSRADLAGDGGNADGSQEVFLANVRTGAVRQFTATAADTTLLDVGEAPRRWAVMRSSGDLATGAAAASASIWVQKVRLRETAPVPVTHDDDGAGYAGFTARGRRIAVDTTADLVAGGNPDGSREVFAVRLGRRAVPVQLTSSAADSYVAGTSAAWPLVVVESRGDLAPGGNADGSQEVFTVRFGPVPRR